MADDRCEPYQSASSCRRGKGGQSGSGSHKRGLNTKIHLAVDAHGMPVRILITEGTRADCSQAEHLIEGIDAEYLLADKGYDSDKIIEKAKEGGLTAVIPPRCSRLTTRNYDNYLYKLRHLVENAFLKLKQWRGIATRYAKRSDSFLEQYRSVVSLFGLKSINDTL